MKEITDENKQLVALKKQEQGLLDVVQSLTLSSDTKPVAEDFLKQAVKFRKSVKAQYDEWLGPIEAHVKGKKAERDSIFDKLDKAIKDVKGKLAAFIDATNAAQAAADEAKNAKLITDAKKDKAKQVKRLIQAGDIEGATELADAPLPVIKYVSAQELTGDGVSTTSRQDYRVDDINRVPDIYFKPRELDTTRIRKAGYAGQEIPGITFFKKSSIAVRA